MSVDSQPLSNVEWVAADTLVANDYNPNRLHKPEAALLADNLLRIGWVQPLLARKEDRSIIDGFHRWRLTQDFPKLAQQWGGLVPVVFMDLDRRDAMVLTVRMNRAKGTHVALNMSELVRELHSEHGMSRDDLKRALGASSEEIRVLLAEDVFVARGVKSWKYSPAWYPVRKGS